MTNNSFLKVITRTVAIVVAAGALALGCAGTAGASTGEAGITGVRAAGAGQHGDDIEGEIWWTTTECPKGVAVPCVDPTVAPGDVYDDLSVWNKMLFTDAQSACLERIGSAEANLVVCDREALVVFTALVTDPSYVPMVLRVEVDPEGDPVADVPDNYVPAQR